MLKVMILVIGLGLGLISPLSGSSMDLNMTPHSTPVTIDKAVYRVVNEDFQIQSLSRSDAFETVNDISLQHRKEDVIQIKGEPVQVNEIPFLGCTEYEYADATIGICDDWVGYVHVDFSVGTFRINGHNISINEKSITEALGASQFSAEDGEVYIKGDQAIKVYLDPFTRTIQGIDFFDGTSF